MRPAVPVPAAPGERLATGRERHDHKITVYLSAAELLDLEHARLALCRLGVVADRGRLVREAIAVLLADLDTRGKDSVIARRLAESDGDTSPDASTSPDNSTGPDNSKSPGIHVSPDGNHASDAGENTHEADGAVPSLTWGMT
ncbi:MAG: hypothetical protein ACRDN0_37960 [Trebonia sp.]